MNYLTPAQRAEDERIAALAREHEAQREASKTPTELAAEQAHREDQPLPSLVEHYGQPYADAYRAVVDHMPARNAAERKMRGRVAHHFAVHVCRRDAAQTSDLLTLAAYAVGYAEQQSGFGAGNARAAREYAAVCCECAA